MLWTPALKASSGAFAGTFRGGTSRQTFSNSWKQLPCPTCDFDGDNHGGVFPSNPHTSHTFCLDNSFCPTRRCFQHQRNLLQSDQDLSRGIWTYGHESRHAAKTQLDFYIAWCTDKSSTLTIQIRKSNGVSTNTLVRQSPYHIWHGIPPKISKVLTVWCSIIQNQIPECVSNTPV